MGLSSAEKDTAANPDRCAGPCRRLLSPGVLMSAYVCSMVGCVGDLAITMPRRFQEDVTYDIGVCLDTECWTDTVDFRDGHGVGTLMGIAPDNAIHMDIDHRQPSLRRPGDKKASIRRLGDLSGGKVAISVTGKADGGETVDYRGETVFNVGMPHGPVCGPVCYGGKVEF